MTSKCSMGLPHFFSMVGEIEDEKGKMQHFLFKSTLQKYFVSLQSYPDQYLFTPAFFFLLFFLLQKEKSSNSYILNYSIKVKNGSVFNLVFSVSSKLFYDEVYHV